MSDKNTPLERSAAHIKRQKKNEKRKAFPPSLSRMKTEYQEFCDEHGGPIGIEGLEGVTDFRHCCRDLPRCKFVSIIERWQQNETTGFRHWPAMAFAADQYAFRRREFKQYRAMPSQSEVRGMLKQIENSARELVSSLTKLQRSSSQISDGFSTWAMPHIEWLDQFISQAAAGKPSPDVIEDGEHIALVHFEKMAFLKRVTGIQAADGAADSWQRGLRRRPVDSFFPAPLF